LPPFK